MELIFSNTKFYKPKIITFWEHQFVQINSFLIFANLNPANG